MSKRKQDKNLQPPVPIEAGCVEKIIAGSADAFEKLFNTYCQPLIHFTYRCVQDMQIAENLVQEVFVRVWRRREQLDPSSNIKAYLYTAAKNEALKHLRHAKVVNNNTADVQRMRDSIKTPEKTLSENDLAAAVQQAIDELPEKSRLIFSMSKYDQLTYAEIAEIQNISVKTVETHMGRALKFLRQRLADFFPLLLIFLSG